MGDNHSKSVKTKNVKLLIAIFISSIVLISSVLIYKVYLDKANDKENDYVAYMGEAKIPKKLFVWNMQDSRSEVINYFWDKYKVEVNDNKWNKTINGEVPDKKLKDLALEKSINSMAIILCAKKEKIDGTFDMETFSDEYAKYISAVQKKDKDGKIIYGKANFTEKEYFQKKLIVLKSDLFNSLKNKYSKENELKDFSEYISNFIKNTDIKINEYVIEKSKVI